MSSVIPRVRAMHFELPLKCAWCGEVRAREGSWRTPSNWDPRESGFSHGICPECYERVLTPQIRALREARGGQPRTP